MYLQIEVQYTYEQVCWAVAPINYQDSQSPPRSACPQVKISKLTIALPIFMGVAIVPLYSHTDTLEMVYKKPLSHSIITIWIWLCTFPKLWSVNLCTLIIVLVRRIYSHYYSPVCWKTNVFLIMQDITLSIALGSATQIAMFVVRISILQIKSDRLLVKYLTSNISSSKSILGTLEHYCRLDNGYQHGSLSNALWNRLPRYVNFNLSLHLTGKISV